MTKASQPLVSILIPCYNSGEWVGQAIRSAVGQTYARTETIVVDDGSTDGSLEAIKSFGDEIRWESGPNRGANAARNRLLELSRGEWLQFLDADDYLLPQKIEAQMAVAERVPCDLVVSPCDTDEGWISATTIRVPWIDLMDWRLGNTISNLWRKEAILAAGGWTPSQPSGQDYDLMFRMLKTGARVAYCPAALAFARAVNPESIHRRAPLLARRRRDQLVAEAAEFLLATGQMPCEVREEAGMRVLCIAERLCSHGSSAWRELERLANRIDPDISTALCRSTRVYGRVYSLLGLRAALWCRQVSRTLKRVIC